MNFKHGQELLKILSDNKSGSAELLEKLNTYLSSNFHKYNSAELISYLKNSFIEFSNIQNYLNQLEKIINDDSKNIDSFFNDFINDKSKMIEKIYKNSYDELKDFRKFITISNSNTLLNYFKIFAKNVKDISVVICESRPVFEGRTFAENLIELGINVKLITEAMVANETKNIDAAVIGADSILQNGNVINKVGSKLLAITCNYYDKPVYVLADKSKFSNSNTFNQKEKPSDEIWDSNSEMIKIENYYFEEIEKELITKIFTD